MKKISLLVITLMVMFIGVNNVSAASASINVSSNAKTVKVGNTVKVTVKVSSSDLGSWEYCISYDSKVLKLTSSTADAFTCVKAGVVSSTSQKTSTETFTFKALKSGSSKVTVKSYSIIGYTSESSLSTTASSVTIKTMTQAELEATYSSNADLKDLSIEGVELTPKFNKDTLEYNVEVENSVEKAVIKASKSDSTASISGTGTVDLTEGSNKFEIVVTAQKGNTKTYVVNIYRKELDPIRVEFDNQIYTVVRRSEALEENPLFELTEVEYENNTIPALFSEITGYTLIGLKNGDGDISMFIYDNDIIGLYREIKSNSKTLFPQELPESDEFELFKKKEIDFNGLVVEGYILSDDSKSAIIYAQDVESGEMDYYNYDLDDDTVQKYSNELQKYFETQVQNYKYVLFGFMIFSIFLIFLLIIRKPNNKRTIVVEEKKKVEEKEKKPEEKLVEVKEIKDVSKKDKKRQEKEEKKKAKQAKKIKNDFDF